MSVALLLFAGLLPLLLAPAAAAPRGRWLPAVAPLPALGTALAVPAGTALPLPWLLLGSHLTLDPLGRLLLGGSAALWLAAAVQGTMTPGGPMGRGRFRVFFLLAMAGNFWLLVAADMALFYLGFALMGLAAYGLVVHTRSQGARMAARRYLVWTLAGEVLLFSGLVQLAAAAGGTAFHLLPDTTAPGAAVALVLAGFGIKLAVPGLHLWLPTAYRAAPPVGAAVLSGPMITAGLAGWLRFLPPGSPGLEAWGAPLIAVGVFGALYGAAVGLVQRDPRVLLGYSSIAKMGVLTAGFGAALAVPAAAPALVAALAFYALHHLLVKGALFLGLDLTGPGPARPLVVAGTTLLALALAGAPVTSGAAAKGLLGGALPAEWAVLKPWLTAATALSTLLMVRYLVLVLNRGGPPVGPTAPAAWLALVAVILALPFTAMAPGQLLGDWLTVQLSLALALVVAWRRPARLAGLVGAVPPGDLLVPARALAQTLARTLARAILRLDALASRARQRRETGRPPATTPDATEGTLRWPQAGALWALVVALFALALTLAP